MLKLSLCCHKNRYGGEAQMRFPAALPAPSNVGPILGSPVYASEYETLK